MQVDGMTEAWSTVFFPLTLWLGARLRSKLVVTIRSFNPSNNHPRWGLILSPFYRQGTEAQREESPVRRQVANKGWDWD